MKRVKINSITLNKNAQPRVEINNNLIDEYTESIKSKVKFPPVIVFESGGKRWLADGWHRYYAHKKANKKEIEAEIFPGGEREAILYSCGVNANHGERRTNEDKRRAVKILLDDSEWNKWSDREIARRCAVDHRFVAGIRKLYIIDENVTGDIPSDKNSESVRFYIDKHGNESEMNISNIGGDISGGLPIEDKEPEEQPVKKESIIKFNKTNDNIEWAQWTWNPVTGCKHNCEYCYAKDIAFRFSGNFDPTFHEERLNAPQHTNPDMTTSGGTRVFVCSMADLFGDWVSNEWIFKVIQQVEQNPQWTFLFLTKNPRRYSSVQFPDNAWIGATVDKQSRVSDTEKYMERANAKIKFISCEPMLEELRFNNLSIFDWVIIGSRSKTSKVVEFQPNIKWVIDLTIKAWSAGCQVYWKPNLKCRPKEHPE